LQLLVAKVLRTQSERTRLAVCLDELESLAERLGRDALRSEAAERRARYLSDAGDVIGTLRVGRQALAWAPSDAPECAARAHLLIASALSTIGRLDDALPHAQAGLAAARRAGNPAVEAMILNQMGMDANNRGDPGAAIALFEQALAHHRQAGNRSNEAGTLANMAYAAFVLGDYSTADVQFLQAADLCRQVGQHQSEGIVQINLALVRSCQGNAEGARACAQAALQLLRLAADRLGQAAALRVSGHAELALGEPERARASFAESRELFEELGLPHLAIESIAGQALQTLSCGDVGTALGFVEEILIRQTAGASLSGTDEPLRIGLVCHQVLAAAGDSRAEAVLATACTELQSRAASISDPSLRRTFLEQVPWHRELLRLRPPGPAR
jgi:tetratricopeptide (TPR) repeat protein